MTKLHICTLFFGRLGLSRTVVWRLDRLANIKGNDNLLFNY